MYCTTKLKLNRFRIEPVESPSQAFSRLGYSSPRFPSSQTVDTVDVLATKPATKLQALAIGEAIHAKEQQFKENPDSTKPLPGILPENV